MKSTQQLTVKALWASAILLLAFMGGGCATSHEVLDKKHKSTISYPVKAGNTAAEGATALVKLQRGEKKILFMTNSIPCVFELPKSGYDMFTLSVSKQNYVTKTEIHRIERDGVAKIELLGDLAACVIPPAGISALSYDLASGAGRKVTTAKESVIVMEPTTSSGRQSQPDNRVRLPNIISNR